MERDLPVSESRGEQRRTKSTINKCHNQNTSTGVGPDRVKTVQVVPRSGVQWRETIKKGTGSSEPSLMEASSLVRLPQPFPLSLSLSLSSIFSLQFSFSLYRRSLSPLVLISEQATQQLARARSLIIPRPPPTPHHGTFRYPLILEMDSDHSETNFRTWFVFLIVFFDTGQQLFESTMLDGPPPPPNKVEGGLKRVSTQATLQCVGRSCI